MKICAYILVFSCLLITSILRPLLYFQLDQISWAKIYYDESVIIKCHSERNDSSDNCTISLADAFNKIPTSLSTLRLEYFSLCDGLQKGQERIQPCFGAEENRNYLRLQTTNQLNKLTSMIIMICGILFAEMVYSWSWDVPICAYCDIFGPDLSQHDYCKLAEHPPTDCIIHSPPRLQWLRAGFRVVNVKDMKCLWKDVIFLFLTNSLVAGSVHYTCKYFFDTKELLQYKINNE